MGAARPLQKSLPSPPGRGWFAAGAFTSRGETGEGSLPRLLRRHPHCLRHYAHELARVLKYDGIGNPQQSYQPTRSFELQASVYRVRGSNPSSGPRRLKSTPSQSTFSPWEKGGSKLGARPRPRKILPSPPGRGWLAAGGLTSRGETGEGSLPRLLRRRPHRLHHYRVRTRPRAPAPWHWESATIVCRGPQIILFRGVFAHPIDLRVNAAIEFGGQSIFEAVEIQNAVFNAELPPELRA